MSSFSCCCRFSIFSKPKKQNRSKIIVVTQPKRCSEVWTGLLTCLHTLQWSRQSCWLPPQPWWGCSSVHREPPGPPESLSPTAGCRRVGSRFVAPSTPPFNRSMVTNEGEGKDPKQDVYVLRRIPVPSFHLLSSYWWPMQPPSVFQNPPVEKPKHIRLIQRSKQ